MTKTKVGLGFERRRSNAELAEHFHRLHTPESGILVVPAIWDAVSARIFQDCGARAVHTTSKGIVNMLGYPGGETFSPPEESLRIVRRIVDVVSVPVSADLYSGYGDPAAWAEAIMDAGAVALHLEDHVDDAASPLSLEEAAANVAAVREAADRAGFPLFINARTDTVRLGGDLDDAVARLNAYIEAGADRGIASLPVERWSADTFRELVARVDGPLSVGATRPRQGSLSHAELEALGVRRVIIPVHSIVCGFIRDTAEKVLGETPFELLNEQEPYNGIDSIFAALAGATPATAAAP